MATIPTGVILIWTGTNATIPSGWSRETTLDDKYPKAWGASVAPNNTGGSNTHTHTAAAHTHTLSHHTHTFPQTSYIGDNANASEDNQQGSSAHTHNGATTDSTQNGSLQSSTVTWSSVNQEPPYYKVIFVKPSGVVAALPTGICAHYYGTTAPASWNFCDGNNSTPDLRNKYLKGAGTGADAGAGSGATTHLHNVNHTHTVTGHEHQGTTGIDNHEHGPRGSSDGDPYHAARTHAHIMYINSATDTINSYTKTDAGGDTVEVAYKKLGVIKATVGAMRKGMVGLWLGATASIPKNWVLCDGNNGTHDMRDKFVKIGATLAENNATGGANTHTHTTVSHTHTAVGAHTHSGGTSGYSTVKIKIEGAPIHGSVPWNHTHTTTTTSGNTSGYSTDNITSDTVNNEPVYRTVAYIQLDKLTYGGSHLLNFL